MAETAQWESSAEPIGLLLHQEQFGALHGRVFEIDTKTTPERLWQAITDPEIPE
jgi:hypothetical protein